MFTKFHIRFLLTLLLLEITTRFVSLRLKCKYFTRYNYFSVTRPYRRHYLTIPFAINQTPFPKRRGNLAHCDRLFNTHLWNRHITMEPWKITDITSKFHFVTFISTLLSSLASLQYFQHDDCSYITPSFAWSCWWQHERPSEEQIFSLINKECFCGFNNFFIFQHASRGSLSSCRYGWKQWPLWGRHQKHS